MNEQGSLGFTETQKNTGPVECLGQTFENDEARREHYLALLAEKLKDPEFRKTPGFPKGTDEAILRLSDPPYYTACPNPFLIELVRYFNNTSKRQPVVEREPLAVDIYEGKNDPILNAHPYHTKVPPKALLRLLLHYTQPGELVLDPFAGSGMLGVAAALAKDADKYLGEVTGNEGARTAILSDIAPIATFIGNVNSNPSISPTQFQTAAADLLAKVREEFAWMYETTHGKADSQGEGSGEVLYTIWSEFYRCTECSSEIEAWSTLVDRSAQRILADFNCPHCDASLKKSQLSRADEQYFDIFLQRVCSRTKRRPVWVHYAVNSQRFERPFSDSDQVILDKLQGISSLGSVRTERVLFREPPWGDFYRAGYHYGITHVHQFFTERNYISLWALREAALDSDFPREMLYVLTAFVDNHASRRNRYLIDPHHPKGTTCGPLPNSLYIPELQCEVNPFHTWGKTVKKHQKMYAVPRARASFLTTGASRLEGLANDSIDYIFADPPFGDNILYSESSFIWEHFLGVYTAQDEEAIVSKQQGKDLDTYRELIEGVFSECYRVLRPSRWMTIEFSNRSNAVWNEITSAIWSAGFVVADVRVLDKKHKTIRQDMGHSMKKDLIISCYKPTQGLGRNIELGEASAESVWAFVNEHLAHLPVLVEDAGSAEVVSERTPQMLFDRLVSFYVQKGFALPLSGQAFFEQISQRYPTRDGMYFLQGQVAEYDAKRSRFGGLRQLDLFVFDEASAVLWIRQQLQLKPQSLIDLQPHFMQQDRTRAKHERSLELKEILDLNFLEYDGDGPVPSQIRSYLSNHFKDLRNLGNEDPGLKLKANGRWYVPDPKQLGDIEKLRVRALLKEFEEYRTSTKRKIKEFRTEAVRAGFKHCYDEQDYQTLVDVAAKLPEQVIQEDEKLLMYYDVASMRLGS